MCSGVGRVSVGIHAGVQRPNPASAPTQAGRFVPAELDRHGGLRRAEAGRSGWGKAGRGKIGGWAGSRKGLGPASRR